MTGKCATDERVELWLCVIRIQGLGCNTPCMRHRVKCWKEATKVKQSESGLFRFNGCFRQTMNLDCNPRGSKSD